MAKAAKRSTKTAPPQRRRASAPARADTEASWSEAEERRKLHAQLCRAMAEFLDHSSVPERGRVAIVARITHRARQGVSRWFKQEQASGALPDALSIFLFAQAFQADANYLFGLTDRWRVRDALSPVGGEAAAGGSQDTIVALSREIAERYPGSVALTLHGDEMEPAIRRGTKVWVQSCDAIQGNGLYAFEVEGRTMVRIVEDRLGEGIALSCENRRYREQVVAPADMTRAGIKLIGKVAGWFQTP